jgi:hypothetical protein
MSEENRTIKFDALINEWQELMCLEEDSASLEDHGIAFIQEDHVLKLTAQYVYKLKTMQDALNSQAAVLVRRVLTSGALGENKYSLLTQLSERFLSSVGGSLRDEIPVDIPRSERRKARQFVIDWSNGSGMASWPELGVSFPLINSLLFCAEHYAGADEQTAQALTHQFIMLLRNGVVSIPRLAVVSREADKTSFSWEKAAVEIDEANGPTKEEPIAEWSGASYSAVYAYFQDQVLESQSRIHELLAKEATYVDPNVRTLSVIDRMEIDASSDVTEKAKAFLGHVVAYSGMTRQEALPLIASSAYAKASEAIMAGNDRLSTRRGRVAKVYSQMDTEDLVPS